MKRFFSMLLAIPLCLSTAVATAQTAKLSGPVRLIVPYAPGGGAIDLTARALQKPMEEALGVPVFVDNRPGGGTKIGTVLAMNAAPDGRTLVVVSAPGWVGYYHSGIFDFKPWETMTPIAQVAESPYSVVTVKANSGIDSWSKLIARAKQAAKPIAGGAPAAGGFTELTFHELMKRSGVQGIFVPYAGAGPAKIALLAGDIDIQMESGQAFASIRNGQTQALAISTPKRFRLAPDIPTFAELGIADTLPTNAYSLWGPPKMAPEVVAALRRALETATKAKSFIETLEARNAIEVGYVRGDAILDELRKVDVEWGPRLATMKAK